MLRNLIWFVFSQIYISTNFINQGITKTRVHGRPCMNIYLTSECNSVQEEKKISEAII